MSTVPTNRYYQQFPVAAAFCIIILMVACNPKDEAIDYNIARDNLNRITDGFDASYAHHYSHWAIPFRYEEEKSFVDSSAIEKRSGPMPHMGKSGRLKVEGFGHGRTQPLFQYRVPSPFRRIVEGKKSLLELEAVKFQILVPDSVTISGIRIKVDSVIISQSQNPRIEKTVML